MPIKGLWLAQQQGYEPEMAGALKWGTGVNAVHAIHGGPGRDTTPDTPGGTVEPPMTNITSTDADYGYCDEDQYSVLMGNGTKDRPSWGESDQRGDLIPGYPSWGNYEGGVPGGIALRAVDHGAEWYHTPRQVPDEMIYDGEMSKPYPIAEPEDSMTSDPSQYEMNTSMRQRDKVRAGSQISGTANEFDAPIASRMVGPKLKMFPGGERHYDMEPRDQDLILRPFWNRTAGTGIVENMQVNEMYVSEPLTRTPPPDAIQGSTPTPAYADGYTTEDPVY